MKSMNIQNPARAVCFQWMRKEPWLNLTLTLTNPVTTSLMAEALFSLRLCSLLMDCPLVPGPNSYPAASTLFLFPSLSEATDRTTTAWTSTLAPYIHCSRDKCVTVPSSVRVDLSRVKLASRGGEKSSIANLGGFRGLPSKVRTKGVVVCRQGRRMPHSDGSREIPPDCRQEGCQESGQGQAKVTTRNPRMPPGYAAKIAAKGQVEPPRKLREGIAIFCLWTKDEDCGDSLTKDEDWRQRAIPGRVRAREPRLDSAGVKVGGRTPQRFAARMPPRLPPKVRSRL